MGRAPALVGVAILAFFVVHFSTLPPTLDPAGAPASALLLRSVKTRVKRAAQKMTAGLKRLGRRITSRIQRRTRRRVERRPRERRFPNEAAWSRKAVEVMLKVIRKNRSPHLAHRGAHAKHHACVKGTLTIDRNRPRATRHGLFARGARYAVWARFSSAKGKPQSDGIPDARGAALKVMGVPGRKLLPSDSNGKNLDLLMVTSATLPFRDIEQYVGLVEASVSGKVGGFLLKHPALAARLVKAGLRGRVVANPLQTSYFSAAPYKLGDTAVKYKLQPCRRKLRLPKLSGSSHLRRAMAKQLRRGAACFRLMVQFFESSRATPIEDFAKKWRTPFHRVATLRIPRQSFETRARDRFCENLSFTPWRTLATHRPLGNLNRVRRAVYEASSETRHRLNGAPRTEP